MKVTAPSKGKTTKLLEGKSLKILSKLLVVLLNY
jgi:hypothetical protein